MATNVIVLVVDGLQASYLGSYGNGWVETPHFDRLAADGFVFDQALTGCPTLRAFYEGALRGRATARAEAAGTGDGASLPQLFRSAGYQTLLLTDEPELRNHAPQHDFEQVIELAAGDAPQAAEDDDSTATAALFVELLEKLPRGDGEREPDSKPLASPFLLWVHARGWLGPWDAPLERRARYVEEEDPEPPTFVEPPHEVLAEDADPDVLWAARQAYAGQLTLLDEWLGVLLEWLTASPEGQNTLLCLISPRGFPLGVHKQLGFPQEAPAHLYGEAVHLAWQLRFPQGQHATGRTSALVEPADLPATLAEAAGLVPPAAWSASLLPIVREEVAATRDRLPLVAEPWAGIRTAAWFLRSELPDDDSGRPGKVELYAKPDDRWEANEVAARCPGVVEKLQLLLEEQRRALRGEAVDITPLDEELRVGL